MCSYFVLDGILVQRHDGYRVVGLEQQRMKPWMCSDQRKRCPIRPGLARV